MFALVPGIKRSVFRENDPRARQADAIFVQRRPGVLARHHHVCQGQGCGYRSAPAEQRASNLQVHHADDDHHHNEPDNLAPVCSLCHGYAHLGCKTASTGGGGGLASRSQLAAVPELSAADLNNLQRAIGAALAEPPDSAMHQTALRLHQMLSDRVTPVRQAYGSSWALDFAAALQQLTTTEYAQRGPRMAALRVLFHRDIVLEAGRQMVQDLGNLPVGNWEAAHGPAAREAFERGLELSRHAPLSEHAAHIC